MFFPTNISILNELSILKEVDELRNRIDALRPFSSDIEQRVLQKLRFDWNFHSNAIEGNSLNYGETIALLMEGVTAKGKPLRDHLDIRGHNEVVYHLLDIVKEKREITESDIRSLHKIMLVEDAYITAQTAEGLPTRKLVKVGEYKTEPNYTITETGEVNHFASPEDVPLRMEQLISWYRNIKQTGELHPIIVAALFHHEFVSIHPFADGNGRMARWLMNLVLLQYYYPITVLKQEKRKAYYVALQKANQGEFTDFIEFIAEAVLNSLRIYDKALKGESIVDLGDLDKEIALFTREIEGNSEKIQMKRSLDSQKLVYEKTLVTLFEKIEEICNKFNHLFLSHEVYLADFSENNNRISFASFYNYWNSNEITFEKYSYQDIEYDNVLHREMLVFDNFSKIAISYQLKEFKVITNNFSLALNTFLYLEDYHYNIAFTVVDVTNIIMEKGIIKNTPKEFIYPKETTNIIRKLYHQSLTSSEIEDFCSKMGQELMKRMKEKTM
jgi:Fic family protein